MSEVYPGLFVGGIFDVQNVASLKDSKITHILTLDMHELNPEITSGFTYKYVYTRDEETFNLLDILDECLKFIDGGRKDGGTVMVHCLAGASRSGAVAIAYVMQKEKLKLDDAKKKLSEKRPEICPNHGFLKQLQIFSEMGNAVNVSSQPYRLFSLEQLSSRFAKAHIVDKEFMDVIAKDPAEEKSSASNTLYHCAKCRRLLFTESVIMSHDVGVGAAAFDPKFSDQLKGASGGGDSEVPDACSKSLFIEPVQWMGDSIREIEGKLKCPKCSAKLGSYKWVGERCPCGTWVCPAFHIQSSKVDKRKVQANS